MTPVPRGRRSWVDLVTPALGLAGWACAGPLLATVLVGRTALLVPSARWLLAALAGWFVTGGVAWLALRGRGEQAIPDPRSKPQRRSLFGMWVSPRDRFRTRTVEAVRSLALLSIAAPLLPLLYVDDAAYHAVAGAAAAPNRVLAAYVVALAAVGVAWQSLVRSVAARPFDNAGGPEAAPGDKRARRRTEDEGRRLALVPIGAVLAMVALNRALLEPLQTRGAAAGGALVLNLACLALAALLVAALTAGALPRAGWPAAVAALAWLAFAPFQEALGRSASAGLTLLIGTAAVIGALRGRVALAGILFGALAATVPAAAGALLVLGAQGYWRAALAGAAAALVSAASRPGAMAALPAPASVALLRLPLPLWGTPHLDNVALGGFYARLFAGSGSLTAAAPPPHALPALALTLATLVVGTWLIGRLAATIPARPESVAVGVCLGALAGVLLAGTAPRRDLMLVLPAVIPFTGRLAVERLAGRGQRIGAGCFVSGYALAGTSAPMFAQAGADLLSRWPPLASLPTLGLLLMAASLALLLHTSADEPTTVSSDAAAASNAAGPQPSAAAARV